MEMKRPRDSQLSRVYRWEDEVVKQSRGVLGKKAYSKPMPSLDGKIIWALPTGFAYSDNLCEAWNPQGVSECV